MIGANESQPFSRSQCATGLRTATLVLEKWQASNIQICKILRISRSTLSRTKQGDGQFTVRLDSDQMKRISLVLNIHAALRTIFDNPKNLYGFPSLANQNDFFNGRSPLEIMSQGDLISLYETYRRIDALSA
ncbi:hypothetical protein BK645_30060 [Pseudomonas protegens]|uniref:antitoxin Xre-like helix-turn-helix domain-containing protein n=1 Tax=Pseudomonas protegens TaxID=380021 RepID=UPI000474B80D|nr:antitoxin Xre-like helix-turn-helix domain-containing protein [Pseudomonas protegens]ROM20502.1 hypothetical protein BK645_30060 [Pseudomonas protegens]ROM32483.1 hypothetical protein BK646_26125 [Pseudomonas protegens]